jgi:large subunit ribosomal protein L14
MVRMRTLLEVADNTGAKKASCIGVIGRSGRLVAEVGDVISANVKEATPDATVKKGEVVKGVVVRTKNKIRRFTLFSMTTDFMLRRGKFALPEPGELP